MNEASTRPDGTARVLERGRPFVNQAGYNLGETKRFTCPGAPDGTSFRVVRAGHPEGAALQEGVLLGQVGDLSSFEPADEGPFLVEVEGFGRSAPFRVAPHLMERVSSRLAYQFFIDVRGGLTPEASPATITGGGPSRDGGGQTLEATFEGLLYASNPALFDRWTGELRRHGVGGRALMPDIPAPPPRALTASNVAPARPAAFEETPDLVKLLLWHAEWAYNHHGYEGPTGGFEGLGRYEEWVRRFGHVGEPLQNFDRQNLLDQLAATCAYYREFLEPYLPEAAYQRYRHACLSLWEPYERHREVRHWVMSKKWIDEGWLEFSEMGNALGQGLLRNLLMYLAERREPDGQPERFLGHARACAEDVVGSWDLTNPVHTWRARNAEHVAPQALALTLALAPEAAPTGTRRKLEAWRDYVLERTDNLWGYRTHDEREWGHPRSKEIGTVAGLAGSAFLVAHLLDDPRLRAVGWSQVDFVFGRNPAGAHLGHKSPLRVAMGGYWEGVTTGWPHSFPHGTGSLGAVRGALDGSPADAAFPYNPGEAAVADRPDLHSTEGWAISNRAWMTAVAFSTLGSHRLRLLDPATGLELGSAAPGDAVRVELQAALNLDPLRVETGWVELALNGGPARRLLVTETGPDSGVFAAEFRAEGGSGELTASYGYLASRQTVRLALGTPPREKRPTKEATGARG